MGKILIHSFCYAILLFLAIVMNAEAGDMKYETAMLLRPQPPETGGNGKIPFSLGLEKGISPFNNEGENISTESNISNYLRMMRGLYDDARADSNRDSTTNHDWTSLFIFKNLTDILLFLALGIVIYIVNN